MMSERESVSQPPIPKDNRAGQMWFSPLNVAAFAIGCLTILALFQPGRAEPAQPPASLLDWFVSPIEINPEQRLPHLPVDINAVEMTPDGRKIWIVGNDSLILYSADGGDSWTRQQLPSLSEQSTTETAPRSSERDAPVTAPVQRIPPDRGEKAEDRKDPKKDDEPAKSVHRDVARQAYFASVPVEDTVEPSNDQADPARRMMAQNRGEQFVPQKGQGKEVEQRDFQQQAREIPQSALPSTTIAARTSVNLAGVLFEPDGRKGLLVSKNEMLFTTEDGGDHWKVASASLPESQFAFSFIVAREKDKRDRSKVYLLAVVDVATQIFESDSFGDRWRLNPERFTERLESIGGHDVMIRNRSHSGAADGDVITLSRSKGSGIGGVPFQMQPRLIYAGHLSPSTEWAIGQDSLVFRRVDSNHNDAWKPAEIGLNGLSLNAIAFDESGGKRGVLVGDQGALLRTTDGGVKWHLRSRGPYTNNDSMATYLWLPAPWYWALSVVWLAWLVSRYYKGRLPSPTPQAVHAPIGESFLKGFHSDKPVLNAKDDALEYGPIALGLSRFLRNQDTEPPLTLAVTGEWGSGKSSIMRMLQHDLEQRGFPTVWFNAWHHQKEESLLAALLQNLNVQAIWPLFSVRGAWLRLSLIQRRVSTATLLIPTVLFCFAAGWFLINIDADGIVLNNIAAEFDLVASTMTTWKGDFSYEKVIPSVMGLLGLGSFGLLATTTMNAAKAIGVDPSKLLFASKDAKKQDTQAQIGFRYQFAKDFSQLTRVWQETFSARIIIFIDDLDRCQPPQVMEILETVNFLVTSGDCFVVLGLDAEQVERCVATQFRDVVLNSIEPTSAVDPKVSAGLALREFAHKYMGKLINIKVPVPRSNTEHLRNLLCPAEQHAPTAKNNGKFSVRDLAERIIKVFPKSVCAPLLIVICGVLAFTSASRLTRPQTLVKAGGQQLGTSLAEKIAPQPPNTTTLGEPPSGDGISSELVKTLRKFAASRAPAPIEETQAISRWRFLWILPSALLGLIVTYIIMRRQPKWVVQDSSEFRSAMRDWYPLLETTRNNPRAVKRIGNLVRFCAMRLRNDEDRPPPMSDSLLVALSLIHATFPQPASASDETWLWKLLEQGPGGVAEEAADSRRGQFLAGYRAIVEGEQFGRFQWPPSRAQFELVRSLAADIQLN